MYLLGIGSTMRQWRTVFTNYALESILYNNDKDQSSWWGSTVSITPDGSTMAVGGRNYSGGRGMFYVFKRSGTSWSQFGNRVVASDGASNDYFAGGYTYGLGIDISGNGNTIVAGAVGDDDNSQSMSGSVYIYENTSTSTYDVGNMVYTQRNFDFDFIGNNERDNAAGFAFNNDGTKLFMGDYATDVIHQYSLSSPYDVSSAVYDYIGFDVSDRVEYIYGLRFKPDGTSFYIVDYNLDDIFQYNLSTAWDITSASYANTLDVSTNANNPYGFSFKPDGTKLFVVGNNSDTIAAYNLSTAWDISSASYASENFSVTSQASDPQDVIFNSAGTKMYVLCMQNDRIYQYSLSTAWDISSASYDSVSFYLYNFVYGEQIGQGKQIEFNSDGTRLWIVDASQSKIFEFSTTTPTWTETKLTSPNPSSSGYYGQAVTIDDENSVILVGTNKENSNTGRVYVYQRTGATWNSSTVQKKELASLTSDLQTNNQFGWSVAVSRGGADAVVGATEVDVGSSTQAGGIYIFTAPKT
jgi:DNA-binding beta-propeller fold protein YncE